MLRLAQFIASVHPATFAAEYMAPNGFEMTKSGPRFKFPNIGIPCAQFGNGFRAMNLEYNLIDIVARSRYDHLDGSSKEQYTAAVKDIISALGSLIPAPLKTSDSINEIVTAAINMCTALRYLRLNQIGSSSISGASALGVGVWAQAPALVASVVTPEIWHTLDTALQLNSNRKLGKNQSVLIIPLYSNVCTIAGIMMRTARSNEWDTYWSPAADGIAYMGMPLINSATQALFIHRTAENALHAMLESTDPAEAHTIAVPAPKSLGCPWTPRVCYISSSGNPAELLQYKALAETSTWINVTRAKHIDRVDLLGVVSWDGAVADAVIDSVLHPDNALVPTDTLLPLMRTNRDIQQRVVKALEAAGKYEDAYKIGHTFKEGLIWSANKQEVYETPSGYIYEDERTKDIGGVQVTNFTVKPVLAARFEAGEVFYRCEIRVRDELRELDIPAHAFETARKLAEYIQTGIALSGNPTAVEATVFESNYARPIIAHLHTIFATLSPVRGISYLGWDPMRAKFTGPDFVASNSVVHSIPVFKPTVAHLDVFTLSTDYVAVNCYKSLPESLQRVIEACAGIIARAYTNSELTPVLYKDTPETRQNLKTLFSLAGQGKIARLNPNFRKGTELQVFQGYPVLATGYNCNQAQASQAGIILLGEKGEELKTETDVSGAAVALRYVLEQLPAWIIRQEGLPCVFSSEDVTSNQIISDGKTVLDAFCKEVTPRTDEGQS